MKHILRPILLISLAVFTINSCKKAEVDTETQTSTDNATAESEFTTVMPTVNSAAVREKGVQKMESNGCPKVEIVNWQDTAAIPFVPITVRFLYDNCIDSSGSGVVRSGTITATFYKPWKLITTGDSVVVLDINVTANSKKYTGTMVINKPAYNSYNTVLKGGKCLWPSGKYVTLEYNKTVTQTSGFGTAQFNDDVFEFTGTANGVSRDGKAYTVNITRPLVKAASCKWISEGTIELTPSGLATRTVDYGSRNSCDGQGTITINGNTFNFNIE